MQLLTRYFNFRNAGFKVGIALSLIMMGNIAWTTSSTQAPGQVPETLSGKAPADVKTEYVDPETGAICVTRPGKVEPLVLTPTQNSDYYQFLKSQNPSWYQRWFQKMKAFFRGLFAQNSQN